MEEGNTLGAFFFQSFVEIFLFLFVLVVVLPLSWWLFKSRGKSRPFQRAFFTAFTAFISLSVLSCLGILLAMSPISPWTKPLNTSILGEWQLSRDTINFLKTDEGISVPSHSLVFNEDGTFSMNHVLNFWRPLDTQDQDEDIFIDASGNWLLEKSEYGQWKIQIKFLLSNVRELEGMQDAILIEGRFPPYQLLIITEQNSLAT